MLQKSLRLCLLVLSIYLIGYLWFFVRDGFCVRRIAFMPFQILSPDGEKEQSAYSLLDQPYFYLAKGRQCYAFVSADNRTVLKIPRFDRYRLPLYCKSLPFPKSYKKRSLEDRSKRLNFLLGSFQISENEFTKETATLYSHLHKTKSLNPSKFKLYDRLHRPIQIDLNQTVFALQEKHSLIMPLFLSELKNGNRSLAKEILSSLLELMKRRAQLGIFNKDAKFLKNYCWKDGRSIQIDIGSFYREPDLSMEELYPRSFKQGVWPIYLWLLQIDADLASWVKEQLDQCSSSV